LISSTQPTTAIANSAKKKIRPRSVGPAISRIDYDLHYIERWSLRMDVMIIIRTIRKEFLSGSGF